MCVWRRRRTPARARLAILLRGETGKCWGRRGLCGHGLSEDEGNEGAQNHGDQESQEPRRTLITVSQAAAQLHRTQRQNHRTQNHRTPHPESPHPEPGITAADAMFVWLIDMERLTFKVRKVVIYPIVGAFRYYYCTIALLEN
eukprot:COSAG01_NODE_1718_length_9396_cov_26.510165_12_plen_143_part_00